MEKSDSWMREKEYRFVASKTPIPTADLVVLKKEGTTWKVLLLVRKTGYAKGEWCIIGGRVWIGENFEDTIKRQEKDLGVKVEIYPPFDINFPALVNDHLNQDKTKQCICSVFPVKIIEGELRSEGEEFEAYKWFDVDNLPELAYDHEFEIKEITKRLNKFYE